ncbi:MAG: DUF4340 domain-containing protein [Spirochaetia bacterium]|jgi:hypothetical protein
MSFKARLAAVFGALAVLAAAFVLGSVFSPQRLEERRSGAPLISLGPSPQISSVDVYTRAADAAPLLSLQRKGANLWEAAGGPATYPASADRVAALLQGLIGLRRGKLASSDPAKMADLGLEPETAHQVVLHVEGKPEIALLIGKRAPSGDEEYVKVKGEPSAFLTRSSLGVLLSQERSYWYELHVLPDDVQAATVMSINVSGSSVGAPFTLLRVPAGQSFEWQIQGKKVSVNQMAATAMVDRVTRLEGIDFAQEPASGSPSLQITVVALNGDRYILRVNQGPKDGKVFLTTSWSPWTYVVDSFTLSRTVFPLSDLLGVQ